MAFKYKAAPTYRQKLSTHSIMMNLLLGLLVVYAYGVYRSFTLGSAYGVNAIVLLVASCLTACLTEAVFALVIKAKPVEYIKNSFPIITAVILTMMVPVNTEPYAIIVATFFAIFFGKLVFGGFGQNVFNPAAVGRAVIFSSFAGSVSADLITSATPTATLASAGWMVSAEHFNVFLNDFGGLFNFALGNYAGAIGETSSLLIILVGVYLAYKEVIDWRVPVTYLGVLFVGSLLVGMGHGLGFAYALYCVLTGGAVFGAVFMLTDPVTNPNTRAGRVVFAALAAVITVLIRYHANLPEGVLYSILLVNILTPVIDKYFDCKQVDRIQKNNTAVIVVLVASMASIFLLGMPLQAKEYESILVPQFTHGKTIALNGDYSAYKPQLIAKEGDTYHVSALGYGLLPESKGGAGGVSHTGDTYTRNEFKITMDPATNAVVSVEFVKFGDTVGFGDKANDPGYFWQFKEATIDTSVDVVSSATYTSESLAAAVNFVLNGAKEPTPLNSDFADYKADVTDNGNGSYTVTVLGYGLLPESKGGAGGVSHTGDTYKRNVFDITIQDGKVASMTFTTFGDTTGIGDKVKTDAYMNSYVGKSLNDTVDLVSSATYTAMSAAAATNAALVAAGN